MNNDIDKEASDLLLGNAVDFLNSGLELIFEKIEKVRDAKLAVVSIQTSVELFAKYRLVRSHGLSAIIQGSIPVGSLIQASKDGLLRTIGYNDCIKKIRNDEWLTEQDEQSIRVLQNMRNALAHFTSELVVEDARVEVAWLLVRVLAMFAMGRDRDQGEMQTHIRFLDDANFNRLVRYKPYQEESVDCAFDCLSSNGVRRCWSCEVDALTIRDSGTYFCYCCGMTVGTEIASYTSCPICKKKNAVCYDPLNGNNETYRGRCLHCGVLMNIRINE